MTVIYITSGEAQYVGGTITDVNGKDISTATFKLGFSKTGVPTTWFTPDVNTVGSTTASRILKILVSATAPTGLPVIAGGSYTCWVQVTDNPEIAPRPIEYFSTV